MNDNYEMDMTRPEDEDNLYGPPPMHTGYCIVKDGKVVSARPFFYYEVAFKEAAKVNGIVVEKKIAIEKGYY